MMSTESNRKLTLGSKHKDPRDRFLAGLGKSQSSGTDNQVLQKSVDINAASPSSGYTALYLAPEEGDERIVRLLLAQGADVARTASDGSTALQRACYFGHELCAQQWLERSHFSHATLYS